MTLDVWTVSLTVAIFLMFAAIFGAVVVHYKTLKFKKYVGPARLVMAGIIAAAISMFIPIYAPIFGSGFLAGLKTFALSVHNTIRLFVVDGDFQFVLDNIPAAKTGHFYDVYTVFFALLFVAAPFLTFSFVLSFFNNASAYNKYLKSFRKEIYVFSELNEKSITLATDIKKNGRPGKKFNRKRQIVFTDVFDKNDEFSFELREKADAIGAICFKKDIAIIKFGFHSRKKPIYFFILGENSPENMKHCLELVKKYNNPAVFKMDGEVKAKIKQAQELATNMLKSMTEAEKAALKSSDKKEKYELTDQNIKKEEARQYSNIGIYVFSTDTESALLVNTVNVISRRKKPGKEKFINKSVEQLADDILAGEAIKLPSDYYKKLKIRRVNDVQSLVFRTLYEEGEKLFDAAIEAREGKRINALILGFGLHGKEMLKALSWYCQMDGYRLYANVFDTDKKSHLQFKAVCPELCDSKHNKRFDIPGEAGYSIDFYPETDITASDFYDKLKTLPQATYVFIALGSDAMNVEAAIRLRSFYLREFGAIPKINSVVYSTEKKALLSNITDSKGNPYNIDFIGDLESSYSEKVIINSALENEALKRHLVYDCADFEGFWRVEYNYRSSTASALHKSLKIKLGVDGAALPIEKRSPAQKEINKNLEHRRWNAYVRSEGYSYGPVRNNIAKTHPDLILYDDLTDEEKAKDNY